MQMLRRSAGFWMCLLVAGWLGCSEGPAEGPDDGASPGSDAGAGGPDGAGGPGASPDGGGGGPGGGGGGEGPGACVSDARFFREQVQDRVLTPHCMSCHVAEGLARTSNLVLVGLVQPNWLEANAERLGRLSELEVRGTSLIVLKPQGEQAHGGGVVLQPGAPELAILEEFVARHANPSACEDTPPSLEAGLELETPEQTLRRAALLLAGRLPTAAEQDDVRFGGLAALARVVRAMTHEEVFYDRMREVFNDHLLVERFARDQQALSLLNERQFPQRYWHEGVRDETLRNRVRARANRAVATEPVELMLHVIRQDRPFTEVLTADYTVVNDYSAASWGLVDPATIDPDNPVHAVFREARIPGWAHAGLMSSPAFVNRFPTTPTNRNRHRARIFFDRFLATDILAYAERPSDPSESAYHNATLNDPQCTICHATMDPVAGLFQNFDERGHLNPPANGWFPDLAPPGFGPDTLPAQERADALRWLGGQAAEDPRFALAMVHQLYRGLAGAEPLRPVQDLQATEALAAYNAQRTAFDDIARRFRQSGHDFRTLVASLVVSEVFRARAAGQAPPAVQTGAGATHLLTPEELDRKLTAILGFGWLSGGNNRTPLLLNRYRLLYGGIDSDGTVERLRAPNGIMVNLAERMATTMACRATARDFVLAPEARRLFPHVEISFVPESDEGFAVPEAQARIRRNLQHLHARILGETLALDDPEIEASWQLFLEVWREGRQGRLADSIPRDLPSACRAEDDPVTGQAFPEDRRIRRDDAYTIRAWMAVVAYLLSDFRFLYE
jgi:hypothetical protein